MIRLARPLRITAVTSATAVMLMFGGPAALATAPTLNKQPIAASTSSPASPTSPPPALTVSITDNVATASAGQQLTYLVTVGSPIGRADTQLLLEIAIPAKARVLDAGGGTIRGARIDFGITAISGHDVAQSVVITLDPIPKGTTEIAVSATAFPLKVSNSAQVSATDLDQVAGRGRTNPGAGQTPAANPTGSGGGHTLLGIVLLVVSAALISAGLVLMFRRTSVGRRRALRGRPSTVRGVRTAPDFTSDELPSLTPSRHLQRPSGRPGAHSLR